VTSKPTGDGGLDIGATPTAVEALSDGADTLSEWRWVGAGAADGEDDDVVPEVAEETDEPDREWREATGQHLFHSSMYNPVIRKVAARMACTACNWGFLTLGKADGLPAADPKAIIKLFQAVRDDEMGGASAVEVALGGAQDWQRHDATYQMSGSSRGRVRWTQR